MRKARYDRIATSYSARSDVYTANPALALFELVGPVEGLHVLDLACGHGLMARELARQGARVVGTDLSSALLAVAEDREATEPLGVRYVHADAASPELLVGELFDCIVCHFGLTDIDELLPVLRNVSRLLSPDGRFVFSILHPCFPGVEEVSGSWPANSTYYDEVWWLPEGRLSTIRREVGTTHRMISTYMNALFDAGLKVDRISEPEPEEEWAKERQDAGQFPVYLVVRSCKHL